jgi:hypothetical protein
LVKFSYWAAKAKILAAFFILFSLNAFSQDTSLLTQVTEAAKAKNISQSRQWLKLLHIERNWLGMKGSQVTSKQFFFSNDRSDSEEELVKTLASFQLPAASFAKEITNNRNEKIIDHSEHPLCKFPARLKYLKNELKEYPQFWISLPEVNCSFQKIYLRALDAKSVSFVFSSYYSDSPGSAFGHTFFRFNRKSNLERQELLDFGIGYAAQVSVTNPVAYALFGLIGGFSGVWTNLPYYYKVREYNDFEARDLWSYDLNLSDEEVEMLALHLWEVGSNSYTYYFFTQNCAFHMLTVLEAAAPRLHLIEHVPFYYVIPADSMKTLFYEKDFVRNISYRPSLRKVFQERSKKLDSQSMEDLRQFARDYKISQDKGQRTDEQYANYLDAVLDLISLRSPNLTEKKDEKMFAIKEDVLKLRAGINHISTPVVLEPQENERPDLSHGSSRFSMNYTKRKDDFGLTYRFAIHDLLDNSIGMPENSQLEFFDLSFKRYDTGIALENFNLFKVLNLNPLNFYEKKMSWGLKLGSRRMDIDPGKIRPFYSTGMEAQVGYSFELTKEKRPFTLWTMARVDLGYADKAKNDHYGYGALGYQVGLLKRFNNQHAFLLTYEKMHPYKLPSFERTEFEFRSSLTKNFSLGAGFAEKYLKVEAYFYF